VEIMIANVRFGSTCKFKGFFAIARSTSSTSIVQEGNYETQGDWCKINLLTHIFL